MKTSPAAQTYLMLSGVFVATGAILAVCAIAACLTGNVSRCQEIATGLHLFALLATGSAVFAGVAHFIRDQR